MSTVKIEQKFTAPRFVKERALAILRHVCGADPEYPAGIINSIYYDDLRFKAVDEKANGDFLKKKVRLRWYGVDASDGEPVAFLEVKNRLGGGRTKKRVKLPVDREWITSAPLDDPEFLTLLREICAEEEIRFETELHPVIHIAYERHRFVCPLTGARVCLDSDIRASRFNTRTLPSNNGSSLEQIVFEIKDTHTVDMLWLRDLYEAGFRCRSFSKYGECMLRTMHGGASE